MKIEFDSAKRDKTWLERGLDFAEAEQVFEGKQLTLEDSRMYYGEQRFQTAGWLGSQLVILIWTPRGQPSTLIRRIISMRKANDREIKKIRAALD